VLRGFGGKPPGSSRAGEGSPADATVVDSPPAPADGRPASAAEHRDEGERASTWGDVAADIDTAVDNPAVIDERMPASRARPVAGRLASQPGDPFAVRGSRSPLVGRDGELEAMVQAAWQAIEFRTPQLITVIGNQGTGKSRLIDELLSRIRLRGPEEAGEHGGADVRVCYGRARRDGPPYDALSSYLRDRFGLGEGEIDDVGLTRVRHELERVFGDQRTAELAHLLTRFLGMSAPGRVPESPFLRVLDESARQHDAIARTVLRRFVEVDAAAGPTVLVFDDLQWADDDTLSVLREIGAGLSGSPVILIASARPELLVRFANWGEDATEHLRIDLRSLAPEHAERMLRELLSRAGEVPQDLVDDAVEMTGGNPYFLEQLVKLFLANGTIDDSRTPWTLDAERAAETELPISVEEAIEARIAALERDERDVLEKGAVFGNVFWLGAIVALFRLEEREEGGSFARRDCFAYEFGGQRDAAQARVLAAVEELVDRDYLLQLEPEDSTIAGDVELVFKHNLERELIANSTEAEKLARYHRLAAEWLETKLSARSEEQLEFLAQLYERGGDERRAAHCYLAGADKARGRYAIEQAPELYERALAMLGGCDANARLDALHNLGDCLDRAGRTDEAIARFEEMLELAWLFDNQAKGGAAHGRLGRVYRRRGEYGVAMRHLRAAHELFARAGDRRGIAGTLDDIGKVHWLRGSYEQALEHHRQALSIRRALGDRRSIALCLANIGRIHNDRGAFKAAIGQFREALDLRRDIGDLGGVVQSLCDLGGVHTADGGYEMALEMFSEAYNIAREIGDKLARAEVLSRLGECKSAMGRGNEAVEHLIEAIELASELGDQVALAECSRRLAEVYVGLGEYEEAMRHGERALEISEKIGSRAHAASAHRAVAEAISAAGFSAADQQQAEEHFRCAVTILAELSNELELARCYRAFAVFMERTGAVDDAANLSRRADDIFGRLHGAATVE
jgi:tetratricopeptide (TPR) repeat protein